MSIDDFESRLTRGQALWLVQVDVEIASNRLTIAFTHSPDSPVNHIVLGALSGSMQSRWHNRDGNALEGLLGAHESHSPDGYRYVLVTDQREIAFRSGSRASIALA